MPTIAALQHFLSLGQEKVALLLKTLEGAGNFAIRAGAKDPIGTAATMAGVAAFGPTMVKDAVRPTEVSQARKMNRLAVANQLRESKMLKSASRHFTPEELAEGLALRRSLEKTAAPTGRTLENLMKGTGKGVLSGKGGNAAALFAAGALLSAGAATGGAASAGVSLGIGKLTEMAHTLSMNSQYAAMLKADPSLKGDPKVRAYFEVLHRMSPYIAGEPHIAAATIKSMVESPQGFALTPKVVNDVLAVEGNRQKTRFPYLRGPGLKGSEADISLGNSGGGGGGTP